MIWLQSYLDLLLYRPYIPQFCTDLLRVELITSYIFLIKFYVFFDVQHVKLSDYAGKKLVLFFFKKF